MDGLEDFEPAGIESTNPPYYIRRFDTHSYWTGKPDSTLEERKSRILSKLFPPSDHGISVFRITSRHDLHRVTTALFLGRNHQDKVLFLPIQADELDTAGLRIERTYGTTKCHHANNVHYDIEFDREAIATLVSILVQAGRTPGRFSKNQMKDAAALASVIGCHAAGQSNDVCECKQSNTS